MITCHAPWVKVYLWQLRRSDGDVGCQLQYSSAKPTVLLVNTAQEGPSVAKTAEQTASTKLTKKSAISHNLTRSEPCPSLTW
mmetsp:Transcript_36193/g.71166  ORF Transcript_36193/g.71166 Transcript_36193/m.71166 type:complete len:82 (-) Transcript_36193:160-405(-)